MNSKEEFTIQMKTKVAEIEEILKRYLPEAEGYQKVVMEAMEYSLMAVLPNCVPHRSGTGILL